MKAPGQHRLTQKISFHAGRRAMNWLSTVPKEERDELTVLLSIQPYLGFLDIEQQTINRYVPTSPFWTEQMQQDIQNEILGALGRMLILGFQAGWWAARMSDRVVPTDDEENAAALDGFKIPTERKM